MSNTALPPADGPILLVLRDGRRVLLGMDWFPLLGRQTAALARQRARILGATHYVHGAPGVAAAGCVCWRDTPWSGPVYSAAQAVADRYPDGAILVRLALSAQRVWLLAALDGAVVSGTDRVYACAQEADVLASLRARYPGIQTHSLALPDGGEATVSDSDALMAVADMLGSACVLQRLRFRWLPDQALAARGVSSSREALRLRPGSRHRLAMTMFAGGLLTMAAWSIWRSGHTPPVANHAAAKATPVKVASCQTPRSRRTRTLPAVLKSLLALPLRPAGWVLTQVQCQHDATTPWQCNAQYRRAFPQATNRSLSQAGISGWQVDFPSLDLAHGWRRWPLEPACEGSPQDVLRSAQTQALLLGSRLQRIEPAFAQIQLGTPVNEVTSGSPHRVRSGMGEAGAGWVGRLSHRSLSIQGPLRSAGLLFDLPGPVRWRRLTLVYDARVLPDIHRSALTLALQGLVYETPSLHE